MQQRMLRDFRPDLLILEAAMSDAVVALIEALKLALPETPLFLVANRPSMQSEKKAPAHGAHAVFAKTNSFSSLIVNAREAFGWR